MCRISALARPSVRLSVRPSVRPSVCLSVCVPVPCELLTKKQKKRRKTKISVNVFQDTGDRCANFLFRKLRLRLKLGSRSSRRTAA